MTSTAVERIQAEDLQHRQVLNRTLATADVMAASSLVRADLRGKPENVRAIAITLHQYGLPVGIQNINACYVVNGKVEFMTHLWTGLAMRYGGHEVWVCDADPEKCGCDAASSATEGRAHIRRGDSGQTYTATFSWEQAKTAGLTDSATYKKFPTDMLGWRALSRAIKRYAPEIVSGLADATAPTVTRAAPRPLPNNPEFDVDQDVVDGEIVEQGEDPGPIGHATAAPAHQPLTEAEQAALLEREQARMAEPGYADTLEQPPSRDEQPEVYDNRRRRANAVMGEVGVKADDARHQLVHTATGGATQSTGRLTAWQVEAIVAFCDRLKADEAGEGDNGAGDDRGPTAVPPPGPVPGEWKARAAEQGLSDNRLLLLARDVAEDLGVAKPTSLKDVTDEVGAGVLERLG